MLTTTATRPLLPRIVLATAAALFAAAVIFFTPLSASAHDELESTDPAAGSTTEALPDQLTLTFSGDVLDEPGATVIEVTDASGTSFTPEPPVIEGNVVTQSLSGRGQGLVTVKWRVVSSDGHINSDEFTFTVAEQEVADSPSASAIAPTTTPDSTPTPTSTRPPDSLIPEGPGALPWVIGGLILFAAVGGAVLFVLVHRVQEQRARRGATSDSATDPADGSEPDTDR